MPLFNIKNKIILLLLLTTLVIGYLSTIDLLEKNNNIAIAERDIVEFNFILNHLYLVPSLANERGLMAYFLSHNKPISAQLIHAMQQTDLDIDNLIDVPTKLQRSYQKQINNINLSINKLKSKRNLALTTSNRHHIKLFDDYSELNFKLIALISAIKKEEVYFSKLVRRLSSQAQLKEYASQERGLIYGAFFKEELGIYVKKDLFTYIYLQNKLIDSIDFQPNAFADNYFFDELAEIRHKITFNSLQQYYLSKIYYIASDGLIDNFNNYIKYKDEQFKLLFWEDFRRLANIVIEVKQDDRLTELTKQNIIDIFNQLSIYNSKILIANKLIKQNKYLPATEGLQIKNILAQVNIDFSLEELKKSTKLQLNITADEWWNMSTDRINVFQDEISYTLQAINLILQQDLKNVKQEKNTYIILMAALISVLMLGVFMLIYHIRRQVRILTKNIESIAVLDTQKKINLIKPVNNDEIGKVINQLNTLILKNQSSIQQLSLFKAVFSNIDQMVLITNADNNIIFINKSFEHIYGYSLDELKGQGPRIFASGKTTKLVYQKLWLSLKECGHHHFTIWNKTKSGKVFPSDQGITALKDSEGKITNYISVSFDATKRVENEKITWRQANVDNLTNLYNRQHLLEKLKGDIETSKRNCTMLAVLFIDLDGFKLINDLQGHDAGDKLLVHVAKQMQLITRKNDILARLGGDEFVIVLSAISRVSDVERIAEKVLIAITKPLILANKQVTISASIGISLCCGEDEKLSYDVLIQQADTAMYKAKKQGKNQIAFYEDAMQESIINLVNTHQELLHAVKNNELRLFYQPIIDLNSGKIIGAESLVRWQHPKKGLVFPDSFIAISEEMGSMVQLGKWVVDESYRQGAQWSKNKLFGENQGFYLSVNVSAKQCADNFKAILEQLNGFKNLNKQNNIKDFLQIEITESMLFNDNESQIQQLTNIKELGFPLLLDDFGTGYSSLSYLKDFPIDKLKIDRSFVQELSKDKDSKALVEAIVSMAHALGIQVVAEGVEDEDSAALLSILRCEYAQGYYYSKPVPVKEFEELVLKQL